MSSNFLTAGPVWDSTLADVQLLLQSFPQLATLANQKTILADLTEVLTQLKKILADLTSLLNPPQAASGAFNLPAALTVVKPVGVLMSVLEIEVGQTAVSKMTFNEPMPPADGAIVSSAPAVATISLGADLETWTCVGVSVGTATMTYTGTSAPPDVGPAQVPAMVVTVVAVPVAEQGDFNPGAAVITGP